MTEADKLYYKGMLKKGRLIPFFKDNDLVAFMSFYITDDPEKYIQRENAWSIEEDNSEGKIFLIDQVWSNKNTHGYSLAIWKMLVDFVKSSYPLVQKIRWNRWKNNKLYIFNKTVKRSLTNA